MKCFAIGIGGTGAKCVEALTHLAAAGLVPLSELHVFFVDPDTANGSLERAQVALEQHAVCREKLKLGSTPLFSTGLTRLKPTVWTPFAEQSKATLNDFFQYPMEKEEAPAAAALFEVLYSRQERGTSLDMGFRGHPSIGAAVFAKTVNLDAAEPWKTLYGQVDNARKNGEDVRIVLFGSIFGGTGAAGIPTLAEVLRRKLNISERKIDQGTSPSYSLDEKVRIGAVLVLPYFSFGAGDETELRANSKNFLMNTQVALRYYRERARTKNISAVYLLGDETLSSVEQTALGAREQRNAPHFVELYAGLAASHFFQKSDADIGDYGFVARADGKALTYADLPWIDGGHDTLRRRLGQLARFSFSYLSTFLPAIEDVAKRGRAYRAPWLVDTLVRKGISPEAEGTRVTLQALENYCTSFLTWSLAVHTSASEERVNLLDYLSFAADGPKIALAAPDEFKRENFSRLVLPEGRQDVHGLSRLWSRVSDGRVSDRLSSGVGLLVRSIYDQCAL